MGGVSSSPCRRARYVARCQYRPFPVGTDDWCGDCLNNGFIWFGWTGGGHCRNRFAAVGDVPGIQQLPSRCASRDRAEITLALQSFDKQNRRRRHRYLPRAAPPLAPFKGLSNDPSSVAKTIGRSLAPTITVSAKRRLRRRQATWHWSPALRSFHKQSSTQQAAT